MVKIYSHLESIFEKLTSVATSILGNSITFIIAFALVLYWWTTSFFATRDMHQIIGDIIFGTTFLSLFIIQKSFNKFSASLHLKINELVSSHDTASNTVLNVEAKTEREITELSKEYSELADKIKELDDEFEKVDEKMKEK